MSALFRQLESANRVIVDEMDLFPNWIRAYPDPFYLGRRRVWLSLRTMPLARLARPAAAPHRHCRKD